MLSLLEAGAFTTATPFGTIETGTHADISAGQGASSGSAPYIVFDHTNGKTIVVTAGSSNAPSLFIW
ncbi:hypothetical protein ACO2KH_07185 [Leptospira terpstrae]|uniref:hypothetical protein n=1 Tax=Leptospira terpstrae TaxID=293075 RepID=UPI003D04E8A7